MRVREISCNPVFPRTGIKTLKHPKSHLPPINTLNYFLSVKDSLYSKMTDSWEL